MIRLLKESTDFFGRIKHIQAEPINSGSRLADYFDTSLKDICKELQKMIRQYSSGTIGTSYPSHGPDTISIQIQLGYSQLVDIYVNTLHDEVTLLGDYAYSEEDKEMTKKAIDIVAKHVRV